MSGQQLTWKATDLGLVIQSSRCLLRLLQVFTRLSATLALPVTTHLDNMVEKPYVQYEKKNCYSVTIFYI